MRPVIKDVTIRKKVFHCRLCGEDYDTAEAYNAHVPECEATHPEREPDIVGKNYIRRSENTVEFYKVAEVRRGAAYGFLTEFSSYDGGNPIQGTRRMRQSYRSVDLADLGDSFVETDVHSPIHLIEAEMQRIMDVLERIYNPDSEAEVDA